MRRKYRIAGLTSLATRELTYGHSLFFMHSRVYIFPLWIIYSEEKNLGIIFQFAKRSWCYLPQFSCWSRRHIEVGCTIFSRDLWLCHPAHLPALSASWQSAAPKLPSNGGKLNGYSCWSCSFLAKLYTLTYPCLTFDSKTCVSNVCLKIWVYPGLQNSRGTEVL